MARPAITYRGARRNLVIRGAGIKWGPQFCFAPGGRVYKPVLDGAGRPTGRFIVTKRWAPFMHNDFLKSLLFAARMAEQREKERAA